MLSLMKQPDGSYTFKDFVTPAGSYPIGKKLTTTFGAVGHNYIKLVVVDKYSDDSYIYYTAKLLEA